MPGRPGLPDETLRAPDRGLSQQKKRQGENPVFFYFNRRR
jgi:hypothetical protein